MNAGGRVGVIVVTCNSRPHIGRCLTALAAQTGPADRIILIDNASTDGTMAEARAVAARLGLAVEWVDGGGNVGFAAANNRGVDRLADCALVATLNPDAFPEPEWLAALVAAAAAHPEAASFASLLLSADDDTILDGAGDVLHVSGLAWRHGHGQRRSSVPDAEVARHVFSACAAAALYRRADWIEASGLDERFFCYAEDVDLGFRLQLRGRRCWYEPRAVARHVGGAASGQGFTGSRVRGFTGSRVHGFTGSLARYVASRRASAFAVYHGHRNLEWTFVKNMPPRLLWRYLPVHIVASVASVAWFVVQGNGGAVLRAKRDALRGMGVMLRQRTHEQQTRRVSDVELRRLLERSSLLRRFTHLARRGVSPP